jgi:hypothetical protein
MRDKNHTVQNKYAAACMYQHVPNLKMDFNLTKIIIRVKYTVGPLIFGGVSSRSINFQTAFLGPLTFCGVSSRSINFQTRFLGPLTFDGVSSRSINFQTIFLGPLTLGGVSSTSIPWCDLARCPLLAAPCPQAPPRSLHLPAARLRRFHVRPSLSIHTF